MNSKQEFTPKYWIGHNTRSDDVLITTANKNYFNADLKLREEVGEKLYNSDEYVVSLFEINLVHKNTGGTEE